MTPENATEPTEPQEPTAADFEPQDEEAGQEQTASSESASGDETQETESQEAGEGEGEQPDPYAAAPEFWSAEKKALWEKITDPELRAAIHDHERQGATAVNKRLMEAAEETKQAKSQLETFTSERDQLAAWWQNMGPKFAQAFSNKWDGYDWLKMASEDPALYTKMTAQRDAEAKMLQETQRRHEVEVQSANQRAQESFKQIRQAEHEKLAAKLPDFAADKAQATYDKLGSYLTKTYKFAPERINAMYEADVIEIAHKAMLYDEAQAKLRAQPKTAAATATQTPKRVTPGARSGQPNESEAQRQAEKRLRTGQNLSDADVERLFG